MPMKALDIELEYCSKCKFVFKKDNLKGGLCPMCRGNGGINRV